MVRSGAGEIGRGQIMKDLTSCGLGKPFDFKQGNDMIRFGLQKITLAGSWRMDLGLF